MDTKDVHALAVSVGGIEKVKWNRQFCDQRYSFHQ